MTSRMYESPHVGGNATSSEPKNTPEISPRAVGQAAVGLATAAKDFRATAQAYLTEHARERPYALLGTAAAVGFVLGGGLASRITMSLLMIGGRMVAGRVLTQILESELSPEEKPYP